MAKNDIAGIRRASCCASLMLALVIPASVFAADAPNQGSALKLEKSVFLMRHGARSPNQTPEQLAPSSRRPWPQWPVGPGELTERGISLLTTLGGYYRQSYAAAGLLPEKGCPEAGTVAAWADNVVRRVPLSAQALLDGMFPGCGLQTGFAPQDKGPDPLFNPVEVGLCKLSVPKASAAILKAARGSLDQAARSERASLKAMQDILQVRSGTRCVNDAPSCGIEDFGNVLEGGKTGVTIEGGLKSAATVGENFLLQYIQGFPEKDVAWGDAATPETLSPLLGPRNLYLRLSRQPPYIAARNGSPLARALLAALDDVSETSDASAAPGTPPRASRLAAFVGRDTHLASITGMLGLQWSLPDQPDQFPMGGTLAFERLINPADGKRYVRMVLYYQTLQQMRSNAPLDLAHPPGKLVVKMQGCDKGEIDGACPLPIVRKHFEAAFAADCPGG